MRKVGFAIYLLSYYLYFYLIKISSKFHLQPLFFWQKTSAKQTGLMFVEYVMGKRREMNPPPLEEPQAITSEKKIQGILLRLTSQNYIDPRKGKSKDINAFSKLESNRVTKNKGA